MKRLVFAVTLLLANAIVALTPAEWRSQSIYFLLTDRFGRDDNSTTAACDVTDRACTTSEDAIQYSRLIILDLLRWQLARDHQSCMHGRENIPFLADYYSLIISKAWASLQSGSPRLPNSFKVTLATVNRTTATGNRKCNIHEVSVIQCACKLIS